MIFIHVKTILIFLIFFSLCCLSSNPFMCFSTPYWLLCHPLGPVIRLTVSHHLMEVRPLLWWPSLGYHLSLLLSTYENRAGWLHILSDSTFEPELSTNIFYSVVRLVIVFQRRLLRVVFLLFSDKFRLTVCLSEAKENWRISSWKRGLMSLFPRNLVFRKSYPPYDTSEFCNFLHV